MGNQRWLSFLEKLKQERSNQIKYRKLGINEDIHIPQRLL